MLYPQRDAVLTQELFKNPSSEYRAAPFWAWNCALEKDELLRQLDVFRAMGFGGAHMHVRTGMATVYLSDEFMDLVSACVEKCRREKMLAWLYDEDRWPSGAAGGIVTKNPEYRLRHLLLTRIPYGRNAKREQLARAKATSRRTENGVLLACFDVTLNPDGSLASYSVVKEDAAVSGFKLYAYAETAEETPWFNNQTYVDTMNRAAMAEFIRVTYARYAEYFAGDFGGVVPAIFTDEPQFSHKTTLGFAQEQRDVTLSWTPDFPGTFARAYPGEDIVAHLPELLWELPGGVSRVRYLYHDHACQRFAEAFADQCGDWCRGHNLMLTGHMMDEATLESQTGAVGEAMRSFRNFQLPGIDMLRNAREYTTAKQAQSACHQFGAPGVLSELYGVTNWDYDFRHHKLHGDWQAALGVTVRVPHLSWVSMNGEAKRDYPATFNYQAPWHEKYPLMEDHFARVNTAMTRGRPVARIGVIHPIESYWLHWGARENTRAVREQLDREFAGVTEWLLRGQLDFDFIAESLLPGQCETGAISGDGLPVGEMRYDVVVVPGCETLRSSTLERLEAFRDAGGRVIFLGRAPIYENALPSGRGAALLARAEHIDFDRLALMNALEPVREVQIRDSVGGVTDKLIYQLREDAGGRWLFLAQADDPKNPDIVTGDVMRIQVRGEWACAVHDTRTGGIVPLECEAAGGWTAVRYPVYDHDSLLLRFTKTPMGAPQKPPALLGVTDAVDACKEMNFDFASVPQRWTKPVPVTLSEPNVLLLDIAEYRLDGGAYRPAEEILRLDNAIRQELGWPLRMEIVAQPWAERDDSTPHRVGLRFTFECAVPVAGAKLALERPELAALRLDGGDVRCAVDGWYVDKAIKTVALPDLPAGEHTLEVEYRFGKKVDLEALYILGDFGVTVRGTKTTLIDPVRELAFGDITRQGLPFYGGNITYHLEADAPSGGMEVEASRYRGHLLGVSVNGEEKGAIIYAPYRLRVEGLKRGRQKLDLVYYGSRVNTFGQLHCVTRAEGYSWNPNSWRTRDEEWSYEYQFWEQGILKSPEVRE